MSEQGQVDRAVERVEALLGEFAAAGDVPALARAEELVRVLMELYGAGLERILVLARGEGDGLPEKFTGDKLLASLLIVHGLHPLDAETRIRRALGRIERRTEDGRLVLEGIEERVARIRVEGAIAGPLLGAVEQAAMDAAPELERVEIAVAPPRDLVQITLAQGS